MDQRVWRILCCRRRKGIGKKLVDEKDFIEDLKEYEGKEVLIPVFRIENLKSYDRNNQKHYFIDKARFVAGLPE